MKKKNSLEEETGNIGNERILAVTRDMQPFRLDKESF